MVWDGIGLIWVDIGWYRIVWDGMRWYQMVSDRMVWDGMIGGCYEMVWYCMGCS